LVDGYLGLFRFGLRCRVQWPFPAFGCLWFLWKQWIFLFFRGDIINTDYSGFLVTVRIFFCVGITCLGGGLASSIEWLSDISVKSIGPLVGWRKAGRGVVFGLGARI
jgi:hypothetical protein